MPNRRANAADVAIGARVRQRRKELGLTQEKLGEALGITFQQVQKYEKGVNRIGGSRLSQISKVLDVKVSYFFADLEGVTEEVSALSDPLRVPGAMDLVRAYAQIENAGYRRSVLDLARTLAGVARPRRATG
jgi:transcriptional regulator with XRE-family HTH domain